MKKLNILFAIFCTLTLCSCMRAVEGLMKPEASGGPYEVYFVMPKGMENSALNDTLTQIYEYPMEWMPHFDPHFKVRHLTPENFVNQVIRIVGNVVLVDIDASNASLPFITTEKRYLCEIPGNCKASCKNPGRSCRVLTYYPG